MPASWAHQLTHAKDTVHDANTQLSERQGSYASASAGISRSWLYTQADIRDQIQRLRGTRNDQSASAIPAGQRATDASLRARLAAALQRNRALADENARLRRQLAHALGAAFSR